MASPQHGNIVTSPIEVHRGGGASHELHLVTERRDEPARDRPQLTPNGYQYDGQVLTFVTRTERLKYHNVQRDPRISVCIDDLPVASNDVVIFGTATCHDQDIWDEARRILGC